MKINLTGCLRGLSEGKPKKYLIRVESPDGRHLSVRVFDNGGARLEGNLPGNEALAILDARGLREWGGERE
jgi:hypothetical protein